MKILLVVLVLFISLSAGLASAYDEANGDDKILARDANAALAQKDYKTAFAKFSVLAEQGKAAAQFNLGAFYLNGQGVQRDEKLAFEWFRKSAEQGNSRALQVMENSATKGNVYAKNELNKMQGLAEPVKEFSQPLAKPQEKPQEKPLAKARTKRGAEETLVYNDPTVAAPGKWVTGISADYSKYKATEPLYYPAGGVLKSASPSYSASQPGVSVWVGFSDITVMASFKRRNENLSSTVPGVGLLTKSIRTNESEFDVRWLINQLSSSHFAPYVLVGYTQDSTSGTENEIDFKDVYSQKDSMLMLGAGTIIPINENIGFRVEGKVGKDKQTCSGNYVAAPGVTLSINSYKYTATASTSRITATMYFKLTGGWNAQLGAGRGSYSAGIGPSFSDTAMYATVGYAYR